MDFNEAVSAHQKWKIRLAVLIKGGGKDPIDPQTVSRDDKCDLGKWIHGPESRECQAHAEFGSLRDAHARFHRVAGEVARKAVAGDAAGAQALLDGDFYQQSSSVVLAITRLRKACGK